MELTSEKVVLSASLLFASYLIVKCPCDPICECNKTYVYASLGLPLLYIIAVNELRATK